MLEGALSVSSGRHVLIVARIIENIKSIELTVLTFLGEYKTLAIHESTQTTT